MSTTKITKRTVDAARASNRVIWIWDSDIRGFGLKVTPSGQKIYVVQYRTGGRETSMRRYTIGKHGSPWTPETARREAVGIRARVAQGEDPAAQKLAARNDMTTNELCDGYFAQPIIMTKRGTPKKASSLKTDKSNIDRHIRPLLGSKRVGFLTQLDIEKLQIDIASGKTATDVKTTKQGRAIVRGGKGTAARTVAVFVAILEFGVSIGALADNPGRGVKLFKMTEKERFLSEAEQLHLGDALERAQTDGTHPSAIAAIRLLALTGCRKSEILGLRWRDIDFERGLLLLPDTKTGKKTFPLAQPVIDYIASLPRIEGNPYVLPGNVEDAHLVGLQKIWTRIRSSVGLQDVRLHDLRHSFASVGIDEGDSLQVIGRLLGHSKITTTQRYAHLSLDPVKDAVERIAGRIAAKLIPGGTAENRVMRIPFMVPVPLLRKATKLAEYHGQTLDAFITDALHAKVAELNSDSEALVGTE
ncbi:MAG TPA: tyrosine-type recombinase/integrase [Stellaceae bacterium]|nr:tyrosine-type recombinase/integrase [Stellaceae bacterium]